MVRFPFIHLPRGWVLSGPLLAFTGLVSSNFRLLGLTRDIKNDILKKS